MIINIKKAQEVKVKPKVVMVIGSDPTVIRKAAIELISRNEPSMQLLADLKAQEREIHKERNKLSNYYHQLEAENAPLSKFSENYNKIEALTDELKMIYDKKQYVEKHGALPETKKPYNPAESKNIFELKELRRSLNNRKSKEIKKLENIIKYPEGSSKRQEILFKIDQLSAEQTDITKKIKALNQYEE